MNKERIVLQYSIFLVPCSIFLDPFLFHSLFNHKLQHIILAISSR